MRLILIIGAILATPAHAQTMRETLLTDTPFCFARAYDAAHLDAHPDQRVTAISIGQHPEVPQNVADGMVLELKVSLRGSKEVFGGAAYCQVGKIADCGMEGDAGTMVIEPRGSDSILMTVGPYGITFEGAADFVTLESDRGDDRSFLLYPAALSACD
jgi:hypothetical protein